MMPIAPVRSDRFISLSADGEATSPPNAGNEPAVARGDALPEEILAVVGGVAAAVAGVTGAFTFGAVGPLALPAAVGALPGLAGAAGLHPVANAAAAAATAAAATATAGEAAVLGASSGTQTGGRVLMHDIAFGKSHDSSTNAI